MKLRLTPVQKCDSLKWNANSSSDSELYYGSNYVNYFLQIFTAVLLKFLFILWMVVGSVFIFDAGQLWIAGALPHVLWMYSHEGKLERMNTSLPHIQVFSQADRKQISFERQETWIENKNIFSLFLLSAASTLIKVTVCLAAVHAEDSGLA